MPPFGASLGGAARSSNAASLRYKRAASVKSLVGRLQKKNIYIYICEGIVDFALSLLSLPHFFFLASKAIVLEGICFLPHCT